MVGIRLPLAPLAPKADRTASKSAKPADKTASGGRRDSKTKRQSSCAEPERHFESTALLNKFSTEFCLSALLFRVEGDA
jgi:hypothetical protein